MSCCDYDPGIELSFDVEKNFDADINMSFDTDVDYNSDLDVDVNIDVCLDIDGNYASWNLDAQAFGSNTAVESNVVAIVSEGYYSSLTMTGYAAAVGY